MIIEKGELMLLLGNDLDKFTAYLFSDAFGANIARWQFEQASAFDLSSDVIRGKMKALADAGVISAETLARIEAASAPVEVRSPSASPARKYLVGLMNLKGNINVWLAGQTVAPCRVEPGENPGDFYVTTVATLSSNAAAFVQEVAQ